MFFPKPGSQYGEGIELDEYKGAWSLVVARQSNDDVIYKQWVYPQGKGKGAGPIDKCLPWKIEIGASKEEAIEFLHAVEQALEKDGQPDFGEHDQTDNDDDLPF